MTCPISEKEQEEVQMKTIGNILWVIFGGGILALLWAIVGLICFISIIGIPLGIQCMKFAGLILWPFGRAIEFSGGVGSFIVNLIWIVLFGWELASTAFVIGLIWCITFVGIPFGLQFIKFAQLAIMPFGARIVKT
jgi:uncharacterized membrane protein YccF (DUF307 family)